MDGGGEDITCEEGQRVDVDMVSMEWKCIPVIKSKFIMQELYRQIEGYEFDRHTLGVT